MRKFLVLVSVLAVAGLCSGPASASQVIWQWQHNRPVLQVNRAGMAMVTFRGVHQGRWKTFHMIAWGAVNALPPNRHLKQVRLKLDFSGGSGRLHKQVWRTFKNACRRYDGPKLKMLVTACKAPDGTYWAIQRYQVALPGIGFLPWLPRQRIFWLRLSHWSGPLAELEVHPDWLFYGKVHELFGRMTYHGFPVYGYRTTWDGRPRDWYGRLVYLATHNSRYGKGWYRENAFVTHNPTGMFCYGFWPHDPYRDHYEHPRGARRGERPKGNGDYYRIVVQGPGVTPDVEWTGPGLHDYNPRNAADVAYEKQMNQRREEIRAGRDHQCTHD